MDFALTPEQLAIRDTAYAFAMAEMAPRAADWDRDHIFPVDILREAAGLGFAAICVDEKFGGAGLGRLDSVLVFESLAHGCPSTAAYLSIHNMATQMIDRYGQNSQRAKWLPDLCSMRRMISYCLTEPNAGSDAASLASHAVREGGSFRVNGSKAFISGGGRSDHYLCMVRTGGAGAGGISCLLIDTDTPGLSFGAQENKLGWHSQPTAALMFDDCAVPVDHLIGDEGDGFRMAMAALDGGRLNIAACSLGAAQYCLDETLTYLKNRSQFGQALSEFQGLQFRLAEMATTLTAARLLVYRAAEAVDKQEAEASSLAAMAKLYATDIGFELVDQAMQMHGGYGYLADYPIERIWRDLRVHRILEGTNEVMRGIIARQLLAHVG